MCHVHRAGSAATARSIRRGRTQGETGYRGAARTVCFLSMSVSAATALKLRPTGLRICSNASSTELYDGQVRENNSACSTVRPCQVSEGRKLNSTYEHGKEKEYFRASVCFGKAHSFAALFMQSYSPVLWHRHHSHLAQRRRETVNQCRKQLLRLISKVAARFRLLPFPVLLPHQQGCHTLRKTCNFSVFLSGTCFLFCIIATCLRPPRRNPVQTSRGTLFRRACAFRGSRRICREGSVTFLADTLYRHIFFFFIHWWRGGDLVLLPSPQPREVFCTYSFCLNCAGLYPEVCH